MQKVFFTLLFCFSALFTNAQISATVTTQENTKCDGVDCFYDGPSILINEIMLSPGGGRDGSMLGVGVGATDAQQGEWIELFNPDECRSIDISCYYLGNNTKDQVTSVATRDVGGGLRIPAGTVVPPLGFVVIRGPNATPLADNLKLENGGKTIEIVASSSNTCLDGNSRLWFPNAGGWFAFYDNNGVAQDAVSWAATTVNYDLEPCVASISGCSDVGSLAAYNAIPAQRRNRIGGTVTVASDRSFKRIPDGRNWQVGVESAPTYGYCNEVCIEDQSITCNGSISLNISGGTPPYDILWDDNRAQTSATADKLCAGTYCATITDDNGAQATVCGTINDFKPNITLDPLGDMCVEGENVTLNGNPKPATDETGKYDGTAGVIQPDQFSPSTAGVGEHEVYYIYVDIATCSDTDTVVVTVHPPAEPTPVATPDTVCLGETTSLSIEESWLHTWSHGVVSNAPFLPVKDRFYVVTATNDFGCEGMDSIQIEIIDPPNAGLDTLFYACPGESVSLPNMRRNHDAEGFYESFGANALTINATSGSFILPNHIAPGDYSFYYIAEPENPCLHDTAVYTMRVREKPMITDLVVNCAENRQTFSVSFTITGGDPSTYRVTGYGGNITTPAPYVFTSFPANNGQSITLTLADVFVCGDTTVTVTRDCGCDNSPGTFVKNQVDICGIHPFDATQHFNSDSVTEPGNVFKYFLHESPGPQLFNPIDSNTTGVFTIDTSKMNFDATYYVSTAVSKNAGGNMDKSDPCYQVAPGVPVAWHEDPILNFGNDTVLCLGASDFYLQFHLLAGKPPYTFDLTEDNNSGSTTNPFTILGRVDSMLYIPTEDTRYIVSNFEDLYGCAGTLLNDTVFVVVQQSTRADISIIGNPCVSATAQPQFRLDVNGDLNQYDIEVSNSLNATINTFTVSSPGGNFNATELSANDSTRYEIRAVIDAPNAICAPIITGSATFFPQPTAMVARDSVYCEGEQILFDAQFTGIGPWQLYCKAGSNPFNYTIYQNRDTVLSIAFLPAGNYTLVIDSVVDLASGCSNSGNGSVNIVVNPSPQVDFYVLNNNGVKAKSTNFCVGSGPATLLVEGFPNPTQNYEVEYQVLATPNRIYPKITLNGSNNTFPFDSIPGTYLLWVSQVKDNSSAGCAGFGDTVAVTINPLPNVAINVLDDTICQGDVARVAAQLNFTPQFDFEINELSGKDDSSYVFSGGNNFVFEVQPDSSGSALYQLSNLGDGETPQCKSDTLVNFQVEVIPRATATIAGNGEWCDGTPFDAFIAVSAPDSVRVIYTYNGILDSIDTRAPGDTISHLLPVGNYTLNLISVRDFSAAACPGLVSGTFDITIQANPVAQLQFLPDPVCLNEAVSLQIVGQGNGPFAVDIVDENGVNNTVALNPDTGIFTTTARYGMEYTILEIRDNSNPLRNGSQGRCFAQPNTEFAPIINDLPEIDIKADTLVCEGDSSLLEMSILQNAPFQVWFHVNNNQQERNGIGNDYSENLFPTDSLTFVRVDSLQDANGCMAVDLGDTLRIRVLPNAQPNYSAVSRADCVPLVTGFSTQVGSVPLSSASYFAGNNGLNQAPGNANWVFDEVGTYDLHGTLVSTEGCITNFRIPDYFEAYAYPIADFSYQPSVITEIENQLVLYNRSTSDVMSWEWTFTDTLRQVVLQQMEGPNPSFEVPLKAEETLGIHLKVTNQHTCADSVWKYIYVMPAVGVYVPTSFSPNNDGINEGFNAVFSNPELLTAFNLKIFNRWGELLKELKSTSDAWNGTYMGEPCMPETYVWNLTYKVRGDDEATSILGKVTILR